MDRRTLFAMQAGLLIFMGIVFVLQWRARRATSVDRGGLWFGTAFLLGGIGLFLQANRGIWPPFATIILGNQFFLLLYCLMERAIAVTTRQRSRMWWMLGVSAATVANFTYYTYVHPSVLTRTIEAIIVTIALQGATLYLIFKSTDSIIRPALRLMAVAILFNMSASLLRGLVVQHLHQADAFFSLAGTITIAALSISFLWIDTLRTTHALEQQAMTDPLTGLLNRRALEDYATRALSRAKRAGAPCSAMAIDINHFKAINDTYGHSAGDIALCAIASALQSSLRGSDMATRIGGDEFFILLPDTDEVAADLVASRLRNTVQALQLTTLLGETFAISISIGAITSRGESTTIADLMHASDIMLYREKQVTHSDAVSSLLTSPKPDAPNSSSAKRPMQAAN